MDFHVLSKSIAHFKLGPLLLTTVIERVIHFRLGYEHLEGIILYVKVKS